MSVCVCLCKLVHALLPSAVSSICNLLLENPEYPRGSTAAATAAPTSILLECGDTETEVCVRVCDSASTILTSIITIMGSVSAN